jgi:hypothetical protein
MAQRIINQVLDGTQRAKVDFGGALLGCVGDVPGLPHKVCFQYLDGMTPCGV